MCIGFGSMFYHDVVLILMSCFFFFFLSSYLFHLPLTFYYRFHSTFPTPPTRPTPPLSHFFTGVLAVRGEPRRFYLQSVQHLFDITEGAPWPSTVDNHSQTATVLSQPTSGATVTATELAPTVVTPTLSSGPGQGAKGKGGGKDGSPTLQSQDVPHTKLVIIGRCLEMAALQTSFLDTVAKPIPGED